MKLLSWIVTFSSLILCACSYQINKKAGETDLTPSVAKSQLSYAVVNQFVFQPKCVSCHGNSGNVNLESYELVAHDLARIERATLQALNMPKQPMSPLTAAQKKLLADWISAGAPRNASGDTSLPPPPDILEPKFASIKKLILAKKCLLCHSPTGKASKVPIDSIEALTSGALPLVVARFPEKSYLISVITAGSRKFMPPAASGFTPVNEQEMNAMKDWIRNGAVD